MTDYPSFNIDVYYTRVHVVCDDDWRKIANGILKKDGLNVDLENAEAFSLRLKNQYGCYVFFHPDAEDRCIYHEATHVLMYVMDECDLSFDVNSSEPIAYLLEYIIDSILKLKNLRNRTAFKGKKKK